MHLSQLLHPATQTHVDDDESQAREEEVHSQLRVLSLIQVVVRLELTCGCMQNSEC